MLIFLLALTTLMGCIGGNKEVTDPVTLDPVDPNGVEEPTSTDEYYHARFTGEFLEEIKPGARIALDPGTYNLTDFLSNFSNAADYEAWNAKHEYVEIREAFDGLEIVIKNINDLKIRGNSENMADTEILTEPRYATVLNFVNCSGVELSYLTIGHTVERGNCTGNVIGFNSTQGMRMDNLDLFGCGAYGLSCVEGSGDLIISNSYIRDCSYTPFEIYDCIGDFQFVKCNITGSDGGGYFERNEDTNLFFFGCSFGQEESNLWYFRDDVTKEDCEFMEPTIYPDYSEGE